MIRRIALVLVAFMLAAVVGPVALAEGDKVELEWIHWKSEATDGNIALAEAFNAKNPDIHLTINTVGDYQTTLMARLAAGNAPDMMGVWGGNYHYDLVKGGHLMELTGQPFLSNIKQEAIDFQMVDGKLWSMPVDMAGLGFVYNKAIFEKLGLNVPKTWDEFDKACAAIKAADITPIILAGQDAWTLQQALWTLASPLVYGKDPNFDMAVIKGEKSYNCPEWQEALEHYIEVRDNYANADTMSMNYSLGNQMIAEGKAAMVMQGIWVVAAIQQYNPDADLGFFPAPLGDHPFMLLGADITIGISSATKHPQECLRVLEFLASDEAAKIWTETVKTISCVKGSDMTFNSAVSDIKAIQDSGAQIYAIPNHMLFSNSVDTDIPR